MASTVPLYVPPDEAEAAGPVARIRRRLGRWGQEAGRYLAATGVPAPLLGYRYRRHVPAEAAAVRETIHAPRVIAAPLPVGVADAGSLPSDAGWFGFSFRDVPARPAGPTEILRVGDARVLAGAAAGGDFAPAILDAAGRSLDLREIRFRPFHAGLARRRADLRRDRAVWIAERVFDNYAHWFTAHLGKLVLLRDRGMLGDLVLPADRPAWLDASLARIGVAPAAELPRGAVLHAEELVLGACDRFRPELLAAARDAAADRPADVHGRAGARVFVSRRSARGRRLLDEDALAPLLARHGFEPVEMERLSWEAQVARMSRTEVILAPHGAGLTNMLFCPAGATIVEIADPAYPNPNFYAMAAALGHRYATVAGRGVGGGHPLRQDLAVDPRALEAALERLP